MLGDDLKAILPRNTDGFHERGMNRLRNGAKLLERPAFAEIDADERHLLRRGVLGDAVAEGPVLLLRLDQVDHDVLPADAQLL